MLALHALFSLIVEVLLDVYHACRLGQACRQIGESRCEKTLARLECEQVL